LNQLPNEKAQLRKLKKLLAPQLDLADRVLDYWMHVPFDQLLSQSRETVGTVTVAMTLDTQAIRKFRTAIDLCRRGEGADASVIARSQFETAVATAWVLFPVVRLELVKRQDKRTRALLTHSDGSQKYMVKTPRRNNRLASHRISRNLRASILAAACEVQDQNFIRAKRAMPGRKRAAKLLASKQDPSITSGTLGMIGAEWYSVLQQSPHTYSGLSLSDLCRVLGKRLDYWYDLVYPFQSRDTHSVNISQYADSTDQVTSRSWFSPVSSLEGTLSSSITSFIIHADIMASHLFHNETISSEVKNFVEEIKLH